MPTDDDRYINLAIINIGEALTTIGNLRQRNCTPGDDFNGAKDKLRHAIAALDGQLHTVTVDPKHLEKGRPGS